MAPAPAAAAARPALPRRCGGSQRSRLLPPRPAPPAAAAPPPPGASPPAGALAMTIPTPHRPATGGGLLQTSLALLFVMALMLGLAWLTKRFGPKPGAATATSSWSARSASARASASWWSKWANNGSWWAPRPAA
jgi:hypothetical protein